MLSTRSQYCPQTEQKREKITELVFEFRAAGWEARMLPLCFAAANELISLATTAASGICFRTYGSIPSVFDVVVVRVFALPLVSGGSNHGSRGFEVFSVWKFKTYIRFSRDMTIVAALPLATPHRDLENIA